MFVGEGLRELSGEIFFFNPRQVLVVSWVGYAQASSLVIVIIQS